MFRKPRDNVSGSRTTAALPSIGRPPSPQSFPPPRRTPNIPAPMPMKASTSKSTTVPSATPQKSKLTPAKPKAAPNGNILTFFKKAEDLSNQLFVRDRFNELGGSVKRRKTHDEEVESALNLPSFEVAESTLLSIRSASEAEDRSNRDEDSNDTRLERKNSDVNNKRSGPFLEDSDSEEAEDSDDRTSNTSVDARTSDRLHHDNEIKQEPGAQVVTCRSIFKPESPDGTVDDIHIKEEVPEQKLSTVPHIPALKREETSYMNAGDFEEFGGLDNFDDEHNEEGEEFQERRYAAEQLRLQLSESGYEGELDNEELLNVLSQGDGLEEEQISGDKASAPTCPICLLTMEGVSDEQASIHVNNCLDGNPTPLPNAAVKIEEDVTDVRSVPKLASTSTAMRKKTAKPGQANPFSLASKKRRPTSAFDQLMSAHAENDAWKTAASSEKEARGRPAFERTCPFYKIMDGFPSIAVDAFRYGAVQGCQAYFLSHFHSDHYIGLTSTWSHGPIYCSKITANLVRQQLKVDPKYVVDLEFEKEREVPNTDGVVVTMISANHCPGSSLFLFEKTLENSSNPKLRRILHCGDFRACRAHVEHPLLRPDVRDIVTGKSKQQKIDVCYLDTTYLNPRYAFPTQTSVIQACADMCVSLSKTWVDTKDNWESMKRERAGAGMVKFLEKASKSSDESEDKSRGRLLVVVGTYSIGKERICLGIAKALKSKIYASPGKQRICAALEDPELMSLLTKDPREAQVHMTPLFEIRADTLDEYLRDYRDAFSRAVAFRPSGWNYKPPNSRFIESPSVQTVLKSDNWKPSYSMKELEPQRGSTNTAMCFGVPYSEHSSFRELSMFCCALKIDKVIPTVNVGSAKSRERMRFWVERWAQDRKKNGLFSAEDWE